MALTKVTSGMVNPDPSDAANLTSGSVPSARLGNVDTSGIDANKDDIALLAFKTQTMDSLARYNLVDQSVDSFEDASGVNASGSTNEVRNAANYYSGKDAVTGSGGTITDVGTDKLHQFAFAQSGGTFSLTASTDVTVTYLVVGGGGAGFSGCGGGGSYGGGGGAGGYRASTFTAVPSTSYTITVGEGGDIISCDQGEDGGDSSIAGSGLTTITATGGGAGGGGNGTGNDGGSGGGSGAQGSNTGGGPGDGNTPSTSPAQGTDGGTSEGNNGDGRAYGGGGGASEAGGVDTAASGGDGTSNSITGVATDYAGGGGGASSGNRAGIGTGGDGGGGAGGVMPSGTGTSGTDGKGGGGGGSGDNNAAGNGGDGVVYLRYAASAGNNDMTLVSNVQAANSAVTKGDIVLTYTDGSGTAVVNTDIIASISRDNGSTYTDATLVSKGTSGGHTILSANDITLGGVDSQQMIWKVRTLNQGVSKETRIQAVSLGWS